MPLHVLHMMCHGVPASAPMSPACSSIRQGTWLKMNSLYQVVAAEARARELQEELTGSYKERSRLAEEQVAASRQLQIVRDSNEAQVRAASHAPLLAPLFCTVAS